MRVLAAPSRGNVARIPNQTQSLLSRWNCRLLRARICGGGGAKRCTARLLREHRKHPANHPMYFAGRLPREPMRHSGLKLTASVYTHLSVSDGAAAVAKLPELPTIELVRHMEERQVSQITPMITLNGGNFGVIEATYVTEEQKCIDSKHTRRSPNKDRAFQRMAGKEDWWAVRDSNPRPPACKADALTS